MPRVPIPQFHGCPPSQPYAIPTHGAVPHVPAPGSRSFGAGHGNAGAPIGGHLQHQQSTQQTIGNIIFLPWTIQIASHLWMPVQGPSQTVCDRFSMGGMPQDFLGDDFKSQGSHVPYNVADFSTQIHESYIPNTISGASQADIGVLVISAQLGEFETGCERGGQTREHVQPPKTLGVSKLLVVVNKMDDPTVNWSKDRYNEIKSKMIPFLRSSGYNVNKDVQFLPLSGLCGSNMKERVNKSVCPWWNGPSLFEALDDIEFPLRDPKGPFRMPIIDKFKDMGTFVMGKVESGSVTEGDTLLVMPNNTLVEVLAIYIGENMVQHAEAGENLRIRLSGIEDEDILVGFVLSSVEKPIVVVKEFVAQLQILELPDNAFFTAGYNAVCHIHSVIEECEIVELLKQIDPKTKKAVKKKVLYVKNGVVVLCRVKVNNLICVEKFSDFPQLGRFTLSSEGKTIAVGKVMELVD